MKISEELYVAELSDQGKIGYMPGESEYNVLVRLRSATRNLIVDFDLPLADAREFKVGDILVVTMETKNGHERSN